MFDDLSDSEREIDDLLGSIFDLFCGAPPRVGEDEAADPAPDEEP